MSINALRSLNLRVLSGSLKNGAIAFGILSHDVFSLIIIKLLETNYLLLMTLYFLSK